MLFQLQKVSIKWKVQINLSLSDLLVNKLLNQSNEKWEGLVYVMSSINPQADESALYLLKFIRYLFIYLRAEYG